MLAAVLFLSIVATLVVDYVMQVLMSQVATAGSPVGAAAAAGLNGLSSIVGSAYPVLSFATAVSLYYRDWVRVDLLTARGPSQAAASP